MAFTVQEYRDLVRLLEEHPEWRAELRQLVLSNEVLALPESIRELARAQHRTGEHLEALAQAQQRTEAHLEALAERVEALAQAQQRTEARLEALVQAQQRTEARLEALAQAQQRTEVHLARLESRLELLVEQVRLLVESQQRMETRLGRVTGDLLELRYREHTAGYFGRWLRRARVVALRDIEEPLEAVLSHDELLEVLRLDLLINGQRRDRPDGPEVWLAVEVAAVVNEEDVERAQRRATLLQQAGYHALPVVAGEKITLGAESSARAQKVAVLQDGQGFYSTITQSLLPRPKTSGAYISSALAGGTTKVPGVVARATYEYW
jgi:hypothetical protein